jgi:galactoside O-acetyltransferase
MSILDKIKHLVFVEFRILKYKLLSNCKNVVGKPKLFHPLLITGKGKVLFGKNVQIGVIASPNYYSHYTFLEARHPESEILIGNDVAINNGFSVVAFSKIEIKNNVLIGVNCAIIDNDGHNLEADKRNDGNPNSKNVVLEENVFLGDNVTVLKGVTIGKNSVVGNGSIVTKDIPENAVAAGNPARVIRNL